MSRTFVSLEGENVRITPSEADALLMTWLALAGMVERAEWSRKDPQRLFGVVTQAEMVALKQSLVSVGKALQRAKNDEALARVEPPAKVARKHRAKSVPVPLTSETPNE